MMYKVMSFLVLCLCIEIIIVIKKMNKLHEAYETLSQKEKVKATAVAFSVSEPASRSYGNLLKQYNRIHINMGDDFCPETGIFTCSKAGVYYFIATLVKKGSLRNIDVFYCYIYKNNTQVLRLYLDPGAYDFEGGAAMSNSVVLSLYTGDTVFLGDCSDPQISLTPWSSFSGFLLYPLTSSP